MLSMLVTAVLLALITVVPVMLAARFAGAERTGFFISTFAVIMATLTAYGGYHALGRTVAGLALAILCVIVTFSVVLKVRFSMAIGLTIIAFGIQLGIVFTLTSFGYSLARMI